METPRMAPSCLLLGHKKKKIQGKNSGLSCNCQMLLGGLPHTFPQPFSPPLLVVHLDCFHDNNAWWRPSDSDSEEDSVEEVASGVLTLEDHILVRRTVRGNSPYKGPEE